MGVVNSPWLSVFDASSLHFFVSLLHQKDNRRTDRIINDMMTTDVMTAAGTTHIMSLVLSSVLPPVPTTEAILMVSHSTQLATSHIATG